jgi:AcrR family transcriptional regulator
MFKLFFEPRSKIRIKGREKGMARRSDHSREELYAMALTAAREIAETEGLRGLTARRIAGRIGYSAGTLYNLFENLDELIVRLNGDTLDELYRAMAGERLDEKPEAALRTLAAGYIRFTREHSKLWSILFEHHLPEGQELPAWHHEKIQRLLGLVKGALAPLFPEGQEDQREHSARVLWSSLHGICSLESAGKLVVTESVEALADSLVTNYVAGLRYRSSPSTSASAST